MPDAALASGFEYVHVPRRPQILQGLLRVVESSTSLPYWWNDVSFVHTPFRRMGFHERSVISLPGGQGTHVVLVQRRVEAQPAFKRT